MFGVLSSLFATLTMFCPALMTKLVMFLDGTTTTGLDMELVNDIMDMVVTVVTKFASLFTIWPLNLILILGLIGFCVSFFFKGKKGVRV